MNANSQLSFGLLVWLYRKTMETDFDPIHDTLLADLPASDEQINKAFRQPYCHRVTANGKRWTRAEWQNRKQKTTEPDLMK